MRGKAETKAERLEADRLVMLELPAETFEPRRMEQASVNSLSLVRFDRNDDSVPTEVAHHPVTVFGSVEQVRICCGTEVVASHERIWEREQVRFDPRHYLALLERKPGAFDHARPLEGWALPECFLLLRRRLEAELGSSGTREFIKVLRLLEQSRVTELAGAVRQALDIGATGSDAVSCILHHRRERPVGLFSLDGHLQLKLFSIEKPDLGVYRVLTVI